MPKSKGTAPDNNHSGNHILLWKHVLKNALDYNGQASLGSVLGKIIGEQPELKKDIPVLKKEIEKLILEAKKLSLERLHAELEKTAPEMLEKKEKKEEERKLPELQGAVFGKVVLRVAPYPSGPLHMGNARQVIVNDEYARLYHGKMLLVIDDTIGSEEKQILPEAYDLIPEGIKWLGVKYREPIIYKSDRLQLYYQYAEELINKGKAYVCSCDSETLRKNREEKKDCPHRQQSVKETLNRWKEMFHQPEGAAALRIRTSMQHPNPAFRDRVTFRICDRQHPRIGKKYRIWPLLDFSWAVDDHLLGITHVIRGKELMIESDMERYIWEIFGWKPSILIHSGLFAIEGVKLSKSKAQKEVKSGEYAGWDDPRTWSLQSLKRRGIQPEAVRKFILNLGLNPNEIKVPIESLYSENKKMIEEKANRYFFVSAPQKIKIGKAPKQEVSLDLYPNQPERGERKLITNTDFVITAEDFHQLEEGKLHRLMDCLNFRKKKSRLIFDSQEHEHFKLAEDKGKILHWLPAEGNVKIDLLMPDGQHLSGLGEAGLNKLKEGAIIQFERVGFVRLDKKEKDKLSFWFAHK